MIVRELPKKYGIPILPHSYLFGHFPEVIKLYLSGEVPPDVAGQSVGYLLAKKYPEYTKDGMLYTDMWPITSPIAWVCHPELMYQFCQDPSLPKAWLLRREFQPFTHLKDLVTLEGAEWKRWRAIYNPGFSAKNLLSMVPDFVEEIQVFTGLLRSLAKSGESANCLEMAMNLTYDVIGRATMGERLHCQTIPNSFKKALNKQTTWVITDNGPENILKMINPFRPLIMGYYNKVMDGYFFPRIKRVIAEYLNAGGKSSSGHAAKPKTITSLAVKAYLNEHVSKAADDVRLDKSFTDMVIAQLKMFMLAGHDTTASTLAFAYMLLEQNPSCLAALRQEHDAVLGSDPSTAGTQISSSPHLLNALPYTLAVIKETLRLFPPVGSVREGQKGVFLTHPDTGARYPTEHFMMFSNTFWEHRSELLWKRPEEFVPERWLAKEGEELHVRKHAFRPFELGPRSCIGQELALLELKAILVITVREMEISLAYDEKAPVFLGTKAYQIMDRGQVAGRPKGGMPFRVRMVGNGK
ncbi:cytochrome P450 [Apodospora peruviana]|uniref:Cytochrome P450 n=1 Tax=Apodospora peruviana TaxID=516989 RepID=A0AAE0I7R5_9PEZI|nr:cytochrome P450 [Apodospora peruviana]